MPRFVRWWWEAGDNRVWCPYVNGGTYRKWIGLRLYAVLWEYNGAKVKAFPGSIVPNERKYHEAGLTFSDMCSGSFNCRVKEATDIFGVSGSSIFEKSRPILEVAGILNTRVCSYILRAISPTPKFRTGYVRILPYPDLQSSHESSLVDSVKFCIILKGAIVFYALTEQYFEQIDQLQRIRFLSYSVEAVLHSLEGLNELLVFDAYALTQNDVQSIVEETGTPAGWYPLVDKYDNLPALPNDIDLPLLPKELFDYLASHKRITLNDKELARVKARLTALFEAGPGAKNVEPEDTEEPIEDNEGEEEITSGAHIPIPTETFLEELSVKMQLHPISIYWLLEELKAEGVRCKPEEQRLLEDRLSVLVLRLLGHRWPKQLEIGEPVPAWASSDGIIPLVAGTGEATLAEQVRARLRAEDGELGVQQAEALLTELTGKSLEEWLLRRFFSRHMSQFKYRPIAWHLASTPTHNGKKKRGWSQRGPAFECLLYYHACSGDALARIRTQYVEPLLRAERQRMEDAYLFKDETTSVLVNARIQELEAFVEKLRFVEEQGFACAELEKFIAVEPLDRWSGDGYLAPASRDELLRNEQAWHVDINDGVRVNIAPLQLAGVLANDVLKTAEARKALADRARWRADEQRWVRDGKLPRCGWMDEQVPESPHWTEREPERIAEQIKQEQKRQALHDRRAEEVEI